jgi:hypothetical protein
MDTLCRKEYSEILEGNSTCRCHWMTSEDQETCSGKSLIVGGDEGMTSAVQHELLFNSFCGSQWRRPCGPSFLDYLNILFSVGNRSIQKSHNLAVNKLEHYVIE